MIIDFTFTDAKAFFTTADIFDIRKATKGAGMTPAETYNWLVMKADETSIQEYAELAATMVIPLYL